MNHFFARASTAALAVLLILAAADSMAYARSICVNAAGSGGCFATIQAAIDSIKGSVPVTIKVAPGMYHENVNIPAKRGVIMDGAGIGSTIVDGGGAASVFTAQPGTSVTFSRLTIQNGAGTSGGGLSLQNGTYTVSNCEITNNTLAPGNILGAGIAAFGKLTITNSTITNNVLLPNGEGGGIYSNGNLTVINSTISGNGDQTSQVGDGGGIFYTSVKGSVKISGSTISGNHAARGGGIDIEGSETTGKKSPRALILQDTIADNEALSGAGMVVGGVTMGILGSTISGNQIEEGGDGFGGGLNIGGGLVGIGDSTITGNSTFNVGGGIVSNGILALDNVTIAGNFANAEGGGIEALGTTIVFNTIIAGNSTGPLGLGPDCARTVTSEDYNLIQNLTHDTDCTVSLRPHDLTGVDPVLGALANNGGPTETLALGAGSHAIDAGDPAPSNYSIQLLESGGRGFHCLPIDQRGIARKGRCDIGAYQSAP